MLAPSTDCTFGNAVSVRGGLGVGTLGTCQDATTSDVITESTLVSRTYSDTLFGRVIGELQSAVG